MPHSARCHPPTPAKPERSEREQPPRKGQEPPARRQYSTTQLEEQLRHEPGSLDHRAPLPYIPPRVAIAAMQGASEEGRRAIRSALYCSTNALLINTGGRELSTAVETCDKKWCNSCSREWSARLTRSAQEATAGKRPATLRHLVLTVPNAAHGALASRIRDLYELFRTWRDEGRRAAHGAFWKEVIGYAWKLEIDGHDRTHTKTDRRTGRVHTYRPGWHPHIHCLLHVPAGFDLTASSPALRAWLRLGAARFGRINAPWITRPRDGPAGAREIAKYAAKPLQIDHARASSLRELAEATHGTRWTGSSGSLQCSAAKPQSGGTIVDNIKALALRATDTSGHFDNFAISHARKMLIAWALNSDQPPITKKRILDAIGREIGRDLAQLLITWQRVEKEKAAERAQQEAAYDEALGGVLDLFED